MTRETVCVAMAVYNGAAYLDAQLDSIAAQTVRPDELVVADDGSHDDSLAIVAAFARRAPFSVRIVRHAANVGILENFDAAFAATRGSIIFYCDQDDVWREDKIATMLARFTPATMLVMHESELVDDRLSPLGRLAPGNARHGRFRWPADSGALHGYGHQMAFRRSVHEQMRRLRPFADECSPGGLAHDLDGFIPYCASLLGDLVLLPDPLVRFRRHAGATSPAGSAPAAGAGDDRLAFLLARDAARTALRRSVATAAAAHGALLRRAGVVRLLRAHANAAEGAAARSAVLAAQGVAARAHALVAAIRATLRMGGFANARRGRALALAVLAAVRRPWVTPPAPAPRGRAAAPPPPPRAARLR